MTSPAVADSRLQLVLGLLRARLEPGDASLDTGLRRDLLRALELAAHHGVSAALAGGLRQLIATGLNWRDLLPILEAVEKGNAKKNAVLKSSALSIASLFDAQSIEHVFLKGAAFILEGDSDAAWRTTTDLDILVAPEDVARAGEVLRTNGYRFAMDPSAYRPDLHHHYAPLISDDTGTFVELHIRLMKDRADNLIPTQQIFSEKQTFVCQGQTINIPCPVHRMVHLIAHAQISNWGYALRRVVLKDLVDAAELSHRHHLDWNQVRTVFAAIGASAQLASFLAAADMAIGVKAIQQECRARRPLTWANASMKAITQPEHGAITTVRILGHYVRAFVRNPGRLSIVWHTLKDPVRRQHLLKINRQRAG